MNHKPLILILSLVVPILVGLLYITPRFDGFEIDFLPLVNATINGTVFFILIFAQPLLIGLVTGMGVFDMWVDFRKIRSLISSEES